QHHETVMLLHQMVVGPKCCKKEEDQTGAQPNKQRPYQEEQQRAPKQTRSILTLTAIEVRAGEGTEDVRRVDQNRPQRHHRNEGNQTLDVKEQQGVTGNNRSNEPDQVVPRTDDPAQGNCARAGFSNGLSCSGHDSLVKPCASAL